MAKSPLGKGLDELLKSSGLLGGRSEPSFVGGVVHNVPIDKIQPNPQQPRSKFNEETIAELAASIEENGVLQPLIVRATENGNYQLIAGERRWRAAGIARVSTLPVIVRSVSDDEAIVFALVENIQREDLNVVDQALAFARLHEEFGLKHEEIGRMLGRSRASISNTMRLRELIPEVLAELRTGAIEMGHARAILSLAPLDQAKVTNAVVQRSISVRNTEKLIQRLKKRNLTKKEISPDTLRLEREISEKIGAPTSIRLSGKSTQKGSVVIRFNSLEELDGILLHLKR